MNSLLPKMERFCGYQPRSVHEVWTHFKGEAESETALQHCMDHLLSEGFLDDRKFAHDYTRGKIKAHLWGPRMIVFQLREKKIDPQWIEEAVVAHREAFDEALEKLLQRKLRGDRQVQSPAQKAGLRRYLAQKGFDWECIDEALKRFD